MKLIGPFKQLLSMNNLPVKGSINDDQLELIENGGMFIDQGRIFEVGLFSVMEVEAELNQIEIERLSDEMVALPGFVDCHTHLCWAGSRARDYASRLSGKTYIEVAKSGGGIWDTVEKTRRAERDELERITIEHANRQLADGITTMEVKSGYGLSVEAELKMLEAINLANKKCSSDLISTCLAAHICPKDFQGTAKKYLEYIIRELLPKVKAQDLSNRVDIFIEDSVFSVDDARFYLKEARQMGFDLVVHADQFTCGGSELAVELSARSVDHLEASGEIEINPLAQSNVISVVLPGASVGLGEAFAPARQLLDAGACVAIASDWNPGSAPMGDLLTLASLLGAYEHLTMAETLAGITYRAALALNLSDRAVLKKGNIADIVAFETSDYREILYCQGKLKPSMVWKNGERIDMIDVRRKR
jgi:imidazolonepropionase